MTREEAIQVCNDVQSMFWFLSDKVKDAVAMAIEALKQTEQPTEVQDILQYLDEYLHPIISPEHWSVYSELYDMISMLPSAQPEQKKGKWILCENPIYFYDADPYLCTVCNMKNNRQTKYCPNCGAKMEGEK